jgi:hypothetical protein
MKDNPWAMVVDGTGALAEYRLHDQGVGIKKLEPTATLVSSSAEGGLRSILATRPLSGPIFSFDLSKAALPFINAVGAGPTLAYHKNKAPASLSLLPIGAPGVAGLCVCKSPPKPFGQAVGVLTYVPNASQPADVGSGSVQFGNTCMPKPRSDLLHMRNPTCDVRYYVGGQTACHHMWSLLDADQEIPWADQPVQYHLKFRFWVQPYNESYHTPLSRTTWGIASPVEFDVPKCANGVEGCSLHADGRTWVHTITGSYEGGGRLAHAAFHCHAPTCLSIAMDRCPRPVSAAACNTSTPGVELLCREEPVYGGTGRVDRKEFDEPGYILQPPCLWGGAEFGLEPPPDTTGHILHSVKTSNATYGHHGEMAWQQMYYF